jgi:Na+-translocating ferredoxin:NAD+ oxidoreductase RnfG subunit
MHLKFYPIIFVVVIVVVMVSLLTFTDGLTRASLEVQEDNETLELLRDIFPEVGCYLYNKETEIYTVYDNNVDKIGYAFYATGQGFGGKIIVAVIS